MPKLMKNKITKAKSFINTKKVNNAQRVWKKGSLSSTGANKTWYNFKSRSKTLKKIKEKGTSLCRQPTGKQETTAIQKITQDKRRSLIKSNKTKENKEGRGKNKINKIRNK